MKTLVVDHGAATDIGSVREVNEDSHLAQPPVFVVADGMGGHDGGDVASEIVVQEFARLAEEPEPVSADGAQDAIAATLERAQERIVDFAAGQRSRGAESYQCGTTCVAALVVESSAGPRWVLANLGDSRIYRWYQHELSQVSTDHSYVQDLVAAGRLTPEQAAVHPDRNVITRALGGMVPADPDYFHLMLPAGSKLLLCSDGVSGMIGDEEICRILGEDTDARDTAERLVAAAVAAGGHDNATAVVINVVGLTEENPYDSDRQRASLEQKLGVLP